MAGIDRRFKLIGQGLPGNTSFNLEDLSLGDSISWDPVSRSWVISSSPLELSAVKPATTTESGTTLVSDTDLQITGLAPGVYEVSVMLQCQASNVSTDIQTCLVWTGDAGVSRGILWEGPLTQPSTTFEGIIRGQTSLDATPVGLPFRAIASMSTSVLVRASGYFEATSTGDLTVTWARSGGSGLVRVLEHSRIDLKQLS